MGVPQGSILSVTLFALTQWRKRRQTFAEQLSKGVANLLSTRVDNVNTY